MLHLSPAPRNSERQLEIPRSATFVVSMSAFGSASQEQLAQYDAHKYFDVIGCHSGKRYRIRARRTRPIGSATWRHDRHRHLKSSADGFLDTSYWADVGNTDTVRAGLRRWVAEAVRSNRSQLQRPDFRSNALYSSSTFAYVAFTSSCDNILQDGIGSNFDEVKLDSGEVTSLGTACPDVV